MTAFCGGRNSPDLAEDPVPAIEGGLIAAIRRVTKFAAHPSLRVDAMCFEVPVFICSRTPLSVNIARAGSHSHRFCRARLMCLFEFVVVVRLVHQHGFPVKGLVNM